jgi:cell division control protein 11
MSYARRRGNKVKKGVQFTLMVVGKLLFPIFSSWFGIECAFLGASGTGRTTFVNTLCESEVLAHKIADNSDTAHVEEGIRIKPANVGKDASFWTSTPFFLQKPVSLTELEEDGVRIALTIVDTPGFGDNIDNEFACVGVVLILVGYELTSSQFPRNSRLLGTSI